MKREILEKFTNARNFSALTAAVLELCESYGPVHSFSFLHNKLAGRATCHVELDSPSQQRALARALGTTLCADQICLDIPVRIDIARNHGMPAIPDAVTAGALLTRRHAARTDAPGPQPADCIVAYPLGLRSGAPDSKERGTLPMR